MHSCATWPGRPSWLALAYEQRLLEGLKADEREFNLEVSRGNYLPRDIQRQAAATALAVLTQSLRSVPDNLEREFSLAPEVVESIAVQIDNALAEISAAFKAMTEPMIGVPASKRSGGGA